MSGQCVETYAPAVMAATAALGEGQDALDGPGVTAIKRCPAVKDAVQALSTEEFDRTLLCMIMCCCRKHPAISAEEKQRLRQHCMHQVLTTADVALGYQSRYKSEISYDMISDVTPQPLMHRDATGRPTTQPSTYWQRRAQDIPGYQPGQGHVRRPDVTIVVDPTRPPTVDNIERIVEVKFHGDKTNRGQIQDYERIAGAQSKASVLKEAECACPEEQPDRDPHELPDPFLFPAFRRQPSQERRIEIDWLEVGKALGLGAATAVAAVATVALVLSPFEGPAGDMAAGALTLTSATATGVAWSRAFTPPSDEDSGK